MPYPSPPQRLHRVSLDRPGLPDEWHARLDAVYERQKQQAPRRKVHGSSTSPSQISPHINIDPASKCFLRDSQGSKYPIALESPSKPQRSPHERPTFTPYNPNNPTAVATRRALGPGWDTAEQDGVADYCDEHTVHGSRCLQPSINNHSSYTCDAQHRRPPHREAFVDQVPQRYIDELNRRWHEDDEDGDADQYMADIMPNAPWRMAHLRDPSPAFGVLPLQDGGARADDHDMRPIEDVFMATWEDPEAGGAAWSNSDEVPSCVSRFSDYSDDEDRSPASPTLRKLKKGLKKISCGK